VIFPSSDGLENALSTLQTCYVKARVGLCEAYDDAWAFVKEKDHAESHTRCQESSLCLCSVHRLTVLLQFFPRDLSILCNGSHSDEDAWCIHRGLLTIQACKDSYERLGLVGGITNPRHRKRKDGKYFVHISFWFLCHLPFILVMVLTDRLVYSEAYSDSSAS
jgi:hypothetical protein